MNKIKYTMLFISILLLYCCNIDLKLRKNDKKWLEPYKNQDSLIFFSKTSSDTITINKVGIENLDEDLLASSYNSVHGFVNYKSVKSNKEGNIITISRLYPKQPTRAVLDFKNDFGSIPDINNYPVSTIIFRGKEREGYMFEPYKPEKPSFQWDLEYGLRKPSLEYFFWDKEFGIVEYKTMEGEVFILEKFIRDGENILEL